MGLQAAGCLPQFCRELNPVDRRRLLQGLLEAFLALPALLAFTGGTYKIFRTKISKTVCKVTKVKSKTNREKVTLSWQRKSK